MTDNLHIDLNVLAEEPADTYHAKATEYLSSHQLLDFIKCPLLYIRKRSGLIADADSPAYLLGRAAHVRVLEGRETYEQRFAFGGPINPKTERPFGSNTKAFAQWAQEQGKPVLSNDQIDLIEQIAAGVTQNDEAVDLLLYGKAEGVVRAEYRGFPSQIRLDWVNPHRGIVDLKTCDDLTWFEADARRYGYARGYTHALTAWRRVLAGLDELRAKRGMLVILLAHAKVETFADPEHPAYDRYSPRLHKHATALITEWADAVLFATRKIITKTDAGGAGFNRERTIASGLGRDDSGGGGERVLRTVGSPACVAKNRYRLPAELPLAWPPLMDGILGMPPAADSQAPPPRPPANTNSTPTPTDAPGPDLRLVGGTDEDNAQLDTYPIDKEN